MKSIIYFGTSRLFFAASIIDSIDLLFILLMGSLAMASLREPVAASNMDRSFGVYHTTLHPREGTSNPFMRDDDVQEGNDDLCVVVGDSIKVSATVSAADDEQAVIQPLGGLASDACTLHCPAGIANLLVLFCTPVTLPSLRAPPMCTPYPAHQSPVSRGVNVHAIQTLPRQATRPQISSASYHLSESSMQG
jgi:hypothetical protein